MLTNIRVSLASLTEGKTLEFDDEISSDLLLENKESELRFSPTIEIKGRAYLAGEELIFQFNASTTAYLPCAICNEMFPKVLEVKNAYYTVDTTDLKDPMLDLGEGIRETLLLELPTYSECHDNACPKRTEVKQFLHQPKEDQSQKTEANPFTTFFKDQDNKEK